MIEVVVVEEELEVDVLFLIIGCVREFLYNSQFWMF